MRIPRHLEELKPLRQWVNYIRIWNATKNGGRGGYDKPPINPGTLRDGMTNNPDTWTDYDRAAANIGKTAIHRDTKHKDAQGKAPTIQAPVEGTGLILAQGYCGVDLDGVIDNEGRLAPFAAAIIERLDTYTEISPSGKGLHLLLYCGNLLEAAIAAERAIYQKAIASGMGKEAAARQARGAGDFGKQFLLDAAGAITDEAGKVYELEIYFYIRGGRYFTVTGNVYRDKPINRNKGAELRAIFDEYVAKSDAYKAAQRPVPTVGTFRTVGRPAEGDQDRKMIESALSAIDPGALDFGEWASIMTALKVLGFSLDEAERFSSGGLIGLRNSKNDSRNNAYRWNKFRFKKGDNSAAGIIINTAKRFNWTPAEAFDSDARTKYGRSLYSDEARAAYGRSLHTEEERRQYGRDLHAKRLEKWAEEHGDGFRQWKEQRNAQGQKKNPQQGQPAGQPSRRSGTTAPREISLDDFKNWKNGRKG